MLALCCLMSGLYIFYIHIHTYVHLLDKQTATITAGGGISYEYTKMQNILTYFGVEYCKNCINSTGVSSDASRKVAGLIPGGVIEIFHELSPSGLTMILGSNGR